MHQNFLILPLISHYFRCISSKLYLFQCGFDLCPVSLCLFSSASSRHTPFLFLNSYFVKGCEFTTNFFSSQKRKQFGEWNFDKFAKRKFVGYVFSSFFFWWWFYEIWMNCCDFRYIYTGKLSLSSLKEELVLDILGLAHKYGFSELELSISEYLKVSAFVFEYYLIRRIRSEETRPSSWVTL